MSQGCQSRSSGPFFPVQLLKMILRCAMINIAHRNTLEEGESRPQAEKGTLQVGMRLSPRQGTYRPEVVNGVLRKEQGYKMLRFRNYWSYSAGLAIAWAINLLLTRMIRGREGAQTNLLVFGGFCIGWVSTTIARYVYPPPKRWEVNPRQE